MAYRLLDDEPASAAVATLPPSGKFVLLNDGVEPAAPRNLNSAASIDETLKRGVDTVGRQVGLTARAVAKNVTGIPSMVGDALGLKSSGAMDRLLDMAGLPQPEHTVERISQDVAGAVGGQGAIAKLGNVMTRGGPIVSKVGDLLSRDVGTQLTAAAAGSGASGVAREEGAPWWMQMLVGLGATAAVPLAAQVRPRGAIPAREQAVIDTAAEHYVPLTYSDVTGKAKRLDSWLEGTPLVGTGKFREQGAVKATAAAEKVVGGAKDELDQTGFRGMDRLKLAAQDGDKDAARVLQEVENAGDDWQKIMQASGNLKLWRARQAADELYTRVEKLSGGNSVPLTKTGLALDDAIAAERTSKLPDKTLLNTLEELKGNIDKSPTDFSAARQLRSDLGKIIANKYTGENALVGAKGAEKLTSVQAALEGDMEGFAASQGGALEKAWRRADEFYKTAVVPYKDKALARALSSDTPDEIYSQFIRVGRSGAGEDRATKFYDALDAKGKAAVRYGMLANAMDDAAIAGKDTISPAKFAQSLEKVAPGAGVFFKGDDKAALDGFTNLMRHAERFGQYTENPPTGQRLIPLVSVLGAAAWPKLAAAIGGGAYVAREATTRPALRDALIRASHAKLGSVEMEKLALEVARQLPATTSRSASQPAPAQ